MDIFTVHCEYSAGFSYRIRARDREIARDAGLRMMMAAIDDSRGEFEPNCFVCEPEEGQDERERLCGSQEVLDAGHIMSVPAGDAGDEHVLPLLAYEDAEAAKAKARFGG